MSLPGALTELDVPIGGRIRHLQLREPTAGEVISLVLDRDIRTPDLVERRLAMELYRISWPYVEEKLREHDASVARPPS